MEFFLTVVMCSGAANICLPPHTFDTKFPTAYECMVTGYAESGRKIGLKSIIMDHPYNKEWDGLRVKNWKQIYEIVNDTTY